MQNYKNLFIQWSQNIICIINMDSIKLKLKYIEMYFFQENFAFIDVVI